MHLSARKDGVEDAAALKAVALVNLTETKTLLGKYKTAHHGNHGKNLSL